MYDTIGIKSPYITEDLADLIQKSCIRREGIDLSSGELIYQITTGSLEGSYDSRISIKVDSKEWVREKLSASVIARSVGHFKSLHLPKMVNVKPYVYIEASVHKTMLGHNVYGGPTNIKYAIKWLVEKAQELLKVELPFYENWEVQRVDVAEVFELASYEACQEWFFILNNASFPRRQVNKYGHQSLYVQGRTTTIKFYHKGPEFSKHDKSRLKKLINHNSLIELIDKADRIIRVEVEVKSRKLEYDYGYMPKARELNDEYFMNIYDNEVRKLLKEGDNDMKTVRRTKQVEKRLYAIYDERLAGLLFGTWLRLSSVGEKAVKDSMPKRTYYRHRKLLLDAGVSWTGTDIIKTIELVPADFKPVHSDKRRLVINIDKARQDLFKKVVNM